MTLIKTITLSLPLITLPITFKSESQLKELFFIKSSSQITDIHRFILTLTITITTVSTG